MLILGCRLGELVTVANPLLLEVVNCGVTCVASTNTQDPLVGKDLLPAFCKAWRSGRGNGPTVAEALHKAAILVDHPNDAAWNTT